MSVNEFSDQTNKNRMLINQAARDELIHLGAFSSSSLTFGISFVSLCMLW